MKQHFWNVTSRDGWWKSLTTWTIALLASGMTCKITQWVYLCFLTHLSALCCCSLHIGGVEGHLFLFQVCFGMWIQLLKLQHPLFMTINASYHLYMLNMSSFSFMNMHGAITTDVTLAASLKLHGIMIKNYVNVERTVSEISAENNIQAFFFFFFLFWVWFRVWFVHFKIEWGAFSLTNLFIVFQRSKKEKNCPQFGLPWECGRSVVSSMNG